MCRQKVIERKNNRVVTYIDCGNPKGKIIVFLHGWGADKENLSAVYNQLTEYYRVISFDLPGFGGSTRPDSSWGSYEYASEIKECLDQLNINYYSIVGHSFGGKVAAVMSSLYSKSVDKLVLIAASCLRNKRSFNWYLKVYSYKILKFIFLNILKNQTFVDKMRSKSGSDDYRASEGLRDILVKVVNEDFSDLLKTITCPVFIYWGENDDALPVSMAEKISKLIRDSGVYIVKNGSHYPFLEDMSIVSIIKSFI